MPTENLRKMAKILLSDLGYDNGELSLLFTNDEEIAKLNAQYRNKPSATDVLSFALNDGGVAENTPKVSGNLLGDVVISVETALRQAKEENISAEDELLQLLIHGVLHLAGYEHENVPEVEVERMRIKESELFSRIKKEFIGIANVN